MSQEVTEAMQEALESIDDHTLMDSILTFAKKYGWIETRTLFLPEVLKIEKMAPEFKKLLKNYEEIRARPRFCVLTLSRSSMYAFHQQQKVLPFFRCSAQADPTQLGFGPKCVQPALLFMRKLAGMVLSDVVWTKLGFCQLFNCSIQRVSD